MSSSPSKASKIVIPRFPSEEAEADWFYKNRRRLEAENDRAHESRGDDDAGAGVEAKRGAREGTVEAGHDSHAARRARPCSSAGFREGPAVSDIREGPPARRVAQRDAQGDRKSTRLNSSHQIISYAVFCLKKKTQ